MITRDQKLHSLMRQGKSPAQIRQIMRHFDSSESRVKAIAEDKHEWSENKGNMYFDTPQHDDE